MKTRLKEEEITDVPEKKSQFGFRNTFPERLLRLDPVPGGFRGAMVTGDQRGVSAYGRIGVSAKARYNSYGPVLTPTTFWLVTIEAA
jgi:hypothetical protein